MNEIYFLIFIIQNNNYYEFLHSHFYDNVIIFDKNVYVDQLDVP